MALNVRLAKKADLNEIYAIYSYAREFMKRTDNPFQWGDDRPYAHKTVEDIELEQLYLVCDNQTIVGVFAFIIGNDPAYSVIYDGQWLNDKEYGVVHRIASNGKAKGVFNRALDFCFERCDNMRIDTHKDNKVMRHLIEKYGFIECGTVIVDNGTPRIAYQLCK